MSAPLTKTKLAEIESRMFDAAQAAEEDGSDLVDDLLLLVAADVPPLMIEVRRLLSEVESLRRWRESAVVVLERIRVGDLAALEVIDLAARDRSAVPGEEQNR